MPQTKKIFSLFFLILFCSAGRIYSQTETKPVQIPPPTYLVIAGRLNLEKHGQEEWLVLHSRDAKTYLISGNFSDKLKDTLLKLGENNLVFTWARLNGEYRTSCTQSYKYEENTKGERKLKTAAECIRYYLAEVLRIADAKKSNEPIPPAQRDSEEEGKALKRITQQSLTPMMMGEIYGTVTALNTKSAFKTLEIKNRDTSSPIKDLTLVITPDTRIAKKIGKEEPVGIGAEGLQAGQEVTATYTKDELKTQALFITITRE